MALARGSYGRVVNLARNPGARSARIGRPLLSYVFGAAIVAILVNSVGGLLGH
jgi:uncharacterized membrane protein